MTIASTGAAPRRLTTLLSTATVAVLALGAPALADCGANKMTAAKDHHAMAADHTAASDIVATAIGADDFNTLVAAVQAAGLVEALQGDGPFTVFAPIDAAFAALPDGTVATLLEPENKDQLVSILTYHVVAGEYLAAETPAGTYNLETLQGDTVEVIVSEDGSVTVDGANVVIADVDASNGVIHAIDAVIMPGA